MEELKPGRKKLSRSKVLEATNDSFGNQSVIAKRCGVGRSAITMFLNKPENKDIRELIEIEREKSIDIAELGLNAKVNEGNLSAIIFYLKTQGHRRGYVERHEIDSRNININAEVEADEKLKELVRKIRDGTNK